MTTPEKLEKLKAKTGLNWGGVAELLGVSRQMLGFVRRGERNFSPHIGRVIDDELSGVATDLTTQTHSQPDAKLDQALSRLANIETLLLKLLAEKPSGGAGRACGAVGNGGVEADTE